LLTLFSCHYLMAMMHQASKDTNRPPYAPGPEIFERAVAMFYSMVDIAITMFFSTGDPYAADRNDSGILEYLLGELRRGIPRIRAATTDRPYNVLDTDVRLRVALVHALIVGTIDWSEGRDPAYFPPRLRPLQKWSEDIIEEWKATDAEVMSKAVVESVTKKVAWLSSDPEGVAAVEDIYLLSLRHRVERKRYLAEKVAAERSEASVLEGNQEKHRP
jgi:hypothetical protein